MMLLVIVVVVDSMPAPDQEEQIINKRLDYDK